MKKSHHAWGNTVGSHAAVRCGPEAYYTESTHNYTIPYQHQYVRIPTVGAATNIAIDNRNTNIPDKHLMEMKITYLGRNC